ncbi:signal recognition particle-docking protein FtsY [Thiohalobacter thiocyanaticus]|uniref:Signal recognition particle receptor FtsY n=1 Tax=Thiohalobacter thiocyanaticus TaxID=585455 RepID=A0A426QK81_9GAMM|nr:signal recognition particle-docking protein FtsY [Thiohalobacter thiocyanaticus]RRQ22150.1 signal recognition particle-docking protein FtsY [Thiohalobacter thiocyanaticus]
MVFGFGRKKPAQDADKSAPEAAAPAPGAAAADKPARPGLFARLRSGLAKTRNVLNTDVRDIISVRRQIDDELLEELETQLLVADVGVEATQTIIQDLTRRVARKQLTDADALLTALREDMAAILEPVSVPLAIPHGDTPYVILMVGVNGVGKTTTIGKLARRLQDEGRSVMLAAGDTFRAAAVEQLQVWGERNAIPVVAQQHGADSAAVIFDALQSARARGADVLIADTAGRLHTQSNLMEELKKVKRVLAKLDPGAPHEVMLVVDAGTGQNALNQAQQFHEAVGVTGLTLTKLDGTAKGGIIFAIAKRLGVPIRFIGVGEGIEDLRPFEAGEFVAALFGEGSDDSEAA